MAVAAGMVGLSMVASIAAPPGPSASADADGANGTALGIPGTLTISESNARTAGPGADWSAVSVQGAPVLGVDENGWTGPAAGLGPTVDTLNDLLCPGNTQIDPSNAVYVCQLLLSGGGNASPSIGSASAAGLITQTAAAVTINGEATGASVAVLPSMASVAPLEPFCGTVGAGWLLNGTVIVAGQEVAPLIVGEEAAAAGGCAP